MCCHCQSGVCFIIDIKVVVEESIQYNGVHFRVATPKGIHVQQMLSSNVWRVIYVKIWVTKSTKYLCKSVNIIKLLAKLGLPFRGHREDADAETSGNYLSICDFFSKYDPDFKSMLSKYFNCTSRDLVLASRHAAVCPRKKRYKTVTVPY